MPPPPSSRSSVSLLNCDTACNYELSCFVFVMDLYMLVCGWYALGGCVLGILKRLSCFVAKKFVILHSYFVLSPVRESQLDVSYTSLCILEMLSAERYGYLY